MSPEAIRDTAIQTLDQVGPGIPFTLKDLFQGFIWNQQERSARLAAGMLFMEYAKKHPERIEILSKTASSQQLYKLK